jgi:hypothetical protein
MKTDKTAFSAAYGIVIEDGTFEVGLSDAAGSGVITFVASGEDTATLFRRS